MIFAAALAVRTVPGGELKETRSTRAGGHSTPELSMEENNPPPVDMNAAPRSTQTLRELEKRARAALSAQRGRISQLEEQITERLEAITSAIREHHAVDAGDGKQLDEAQAAWKQERADAEAALAKQRADLQVRAAKQDERSNQLAELGCELEGRQAALANAEEKLSQRETELHSLREQFEARDAQLREEAAGLVEKRRQFDERQAALEKQASELSWRESELEKRSENVDRKQTGEQEQFAAREAAWKTERAALESARDELAQKLANLEAQQKGSTGDWQAQLAEFERKLQDQNSSWKAQRAEWDKNRAELERERNELQHKFELALKDVQRFRGRAAELEQELARRPEASQADSPELIALRAERDALADRVEQLERQPAGQSDSDAQQQMADLQRRFELAVEDVRELKTKNAQLEAQLADVSARPGAPAEGGGSDWESLKRRMLASLEGEAEDGDTEREEERATIQNTIEMTDAVVAEKDREIQELRSQLAEASATQSASEDKQQQDKINELLDADELIAEHRKRIAQLERDMEEKLRAAELELSVERAKLAREKTELEELRADLESRRSAHDSANPTAGAPRRRWLSKLGLSGEEQS